MRPLPPTLGDIDRVVAELNLWEHGRRNMALRSGGALPIVCPVADRSHVAGIGIFRDSLRR